MIQTSRLRPWWSLIGALAIILLAGAACSVGTDAEPIIITATPQFDAEGNLMIPPTMTPDRPTDTPIVPTPNPTRESVPRGGIYTVRAGDTLGTIATRHGVTVAEITALNPELNPDSLEIGQIIRLPELDVTTGPEHKIIPDSELVRGPTSSDFSIAGFVKYQQGFLRAYSESVDGEVWSGVEIIDFVSRNYSVNPRLLLALLEYRGGWVTEAYPSEDQVTYPMGIHREPRTGLLRQMLDAADALNAGYYGWKYRGAVSTTLGDGQRVYFAPSLNAGTIAVQHMLGQTTPPDQWRQDVQPDGFFQTYLRLFGDPFVNAYEPLVPSDLTQPALELPIPRGEEWVYTGGPHGGYNSGSAWSAIDLAPPKPPDELIMAQGSCYVSPNWVTAAAPGVIAYSGDGYVLLDLDGDGDENTGWVVVYLHIDDHERIEQGTRVETGDRLGHPSCQGGFSNGTHLHFGRRYNGEWIPVICTDCAPGVTVPPFKLGEWTAYGYPGQEYQGYMTRDGDDGYRQADQMRDFELNKISW